MTTPEKDQVVDNTSAEDNTGVGATSSAPNTNEAAAGSSEPAEQPETEVLEAEVIEPADEGEAGEGELDPQLAAEAEEAVAGVAEESELVAQAKAEVAEWQGKYMRLHAEWDTYRRRTNEQREAEKARATEKLVENLLPVLDDFERTIEYAQNNGETGLLGGVQAVHNKLIDTLVKSGVVVINPEGEPFDALEAQAVATVPDEEAFDETVAQVYQKGYRMGVKVLRPAMVTVTTGGPKRPAEETD